MLHEKKYSVEIDKIGHCQFDICISRNRSKGKRFVRLLFDKEAFLSYLKEVEEARNREQAAKEEAKRLKESRRASSAVDAKIEAIGIVSLDSDSVITAARSAFQDLTDEQKEMVEKLSTLETAESKLTELKLEVERIAAEKARLEAIEEAESDRIHQRDDALERFEIPEGSTRIGRFAFRGCHELREVIIPDNVKTIGQGAFSGCFKLEKVRFPDSLEEIGDRAFFGCKSLEKIRLSKELRRIGSGAFLGCESLEEIEIPAGVIDIASDAFNGCPVQARISPSCEEEGEAPPVDGPFISRYNAALSESERRAILLDIVGEEDVRKNCIKHLKWCADVLRVMHPRAAANCQSDIDYLKRLSPARLP